MEAARLVHTVVFMIRELNNVKYCAKKIISSITTVNVNVLTGITARILNVSQRIVHKEPTTHRKL